MFIAHKNDIPVGTAKALDCYGNLRMLSRTEEQFHLLENVCPHQKVIINTSKQRDELVCPYHGRKWNMDGSSKDEKCSSIQAPASFHQHCGMLFDSPIDFGSTFPIPEEFDLMVSWIHKVNAQSKAIMDVFLDVDHIPHAHQGVYESIGLTDNLNVAWVFKSWGSIQLAIENQKICAVWIAQYPGTMIEWQPGALFITQCIPTDSKTSTDVQVFQYKDRTATEEGFAANQKIWNTAWSQDVDLAERMVKWPLRTGEEAKDQFRDWVKRDAINSQ